MPSFADSIFLFVLALLLFGPKKLPVLARELGKWMGEFRRASNEFKMQMDEELRASEQADRQKQIAAMEAAAPVPPPLNEPEEPAHPHLRYATAEPTSETGETTLPASAGDTTDSAASESMAPAASQDAFPGTFAVTEAEPHASHFAAQSSEPPPPPDRYTSASTTSVEPTPSEAAPLPTADGARPIPIATSGSLKMMPPATGLPTPRSSRPNALSGLVDSIPETHANGEAANAERQPESLRSAAPESIAHGD